MLSRVETIGEPAPAARKRTQIVLVASRFTRCRQPNEMRVALLERSVDEELIGIAAVLGVEAVSNQRDQLDLPATDAAVSRSAALLPPREPATRVATPLVRQAGER